MQRDADPAPQSRQHAPVQALAPPCQQEGPKEGLQVALRFHLLLTALFRTCPHLLWMVWVPNHEDEAMGAPTP